MDTNLTCNIRRQRRLRSSRHKWGDNSKKDQKGLKLEYIKWTGSSSGLLWTRQLTFGFRRVHYLTRNESESFWKKRLLGKGNYLPISALSCYKRSCPSERFIQNDVGTADPISQQTEWYYCLALGILWVTRRQAILSEVSVVFSVPPDKFRTSTSKEVTNASCYIVCYAWHNKCHKIRNCRTIAASLNCL